MVYRATIDLVSKVTQLSSTIVRESRINIIPRILYAGSIPDGVFGFFNLPNPSSRTMGLGVH
jgi:hypothetical protein